MSRVIDLGLGKRKNRGGSYLKNAALIVWLFAGIFQILWLFTEEDKNDVIITPQRDCESEWSQPYERSAYGESHYWK